ncbi:MAG: glycosyltransferase family 2 protein [Clostridia bacterium]|nr:glycosyltransferase family 2 protein [Clostridia bacterium]
MDISVVIVTYNNRDLVTDTIASLYKSRCSCAFEVIVVDNDSVDHTASAVEHSYPNVKVIRSSKNLGFSRANNIGISKASGKYILLLNPDVIMFDDVLDKMVRFMDQNPDCGASSCKLLNPNGSLQYSVRRFAGFVDILLCRTPLKKFVPEAVRNKVDHYYLMKDWDHNEIMEVDWFLGAFMLLRKEALQKVGGLNEKFFMYFEDVDLCYRIRKEGYKVMYYHSPSIVHIYSQDSVKSFGKMSLVHLSSCFKFYMSHIKLLFHSLYFINNNQHKEEMSSL